MSNFISFGNDGEDIKETNYFDSEMAKNGYLYLSWNSGVARLLLPDNRMDWMSEIKTGEYVVMSRGILDGKDSLELMFEDHSDTPYSITMTTMEQSDQLPPQKGTTKLTVWTREGKQLSLKCKCRSVLELPCLAAWKD